MHEIIYFKYTRTYKISFFSKYNARNAENTLEINYSLIIGVSWKKRAGKRANLSSNDFDE